MARRSKRFTKKPSELTKATESLNEATKDLETALKEIEVALDKLEELSRLRKQVAHQYLNLLSYRIPNPVPRTTAILLQFLSIPDRLSYQSSYPHSLDLNSCKCCDLSIQTIRKPDSSSTTVSIFRILWIPQQHYSFIKNTPPLTVLSVSRTSTVKCMNSSSQSFPRRPLPRPHSLQSSSNPSDIKT